MFEYREPFEFYLLSTLTFILTKDFYTLNDYPASKISLVIIYELSLAAQWSSFKLKQKIKLS